jgi:hypothetical protein
MGPLKANSLTSRARSYGYQPPVLQPPLLYNRSVYLFHNFHIHGLLFNFSATVDLQENVQKLFDERRSDMLRALVCYCASLRRTILLQNKTSRK